jgi:hemolysin activation/secretion protein
MKSVATFCWPAIRFASWIVILFCCGPLSGQPAKPAPKAENMQPLQPGAENIQGILVVPRMEDVNPAGVRGIKGVVVKGPDFLLGHDVDHLILKWKLEHYLGKPLTTNSLTAMQSDIIRYCRERGHLIIDVFLKEQDILENTIQVAVLEAKVSKVSVATNQFHHWFSDSLILGQVRQKPGDTVNETRLNDDLNWLNRNTYQSLGYFSGSFREVNANFQQGELGETEVKLNVKDRFPVRVFAGVEDSGIEVIGRDRLFAGFNWANAFWLDHRLTYEYVTDTDFDKLREHQASYVIPLPWKHEISLFGAYAEINPDFSVINPDFANLNGSGTFYQLSARYSIPLPSGRNYEHEISAGFDFKNTDTPLLFEGGAPGSLVATNDIDVAQFVAGYSGRLKDHWGVTAVSLQGVYSPGGMTGRNHQSDYTDFSAGTHPNYLYGRLELRRETMLGKQFSWYTRAVGQYADSKLIATEQMSIGGYDTVRGYDERVVSGDHGWLLINELRSPRLMLGTFSNQAKKSDWAQALVFVDYGGVINKNLQPLQSAKEVLLSVGVGLRYQLANNFCARFDYGFQLDREYVKPGLGPQPSSRAHFGVELSF